ncbi:hypothetical protein [Streptomyces sp. NBC_01378]|uniref:hypothetical protein n=1 Tax=Streptomyces sp. NBC_01378 TaxID=2903844 RepID=UPI00386D647E
MNGDEQLLRGRVYGRDHDDPNPGPLQHRTYATLISGPLDGLLLADGLRAGRAGTHLASLLSLRSCAGGIQVQGSAGEPSRFSP